MKPAYGSGIGEHLQAVRKNSKKNSLKGKTRDIPDDIFVNECCKAMASLKKRRPVVCEQDWGHIGMTAP